MFIFKAQIVFKDEPQPVVREWRIDKKSASASIAALRQEAVFQALPSRFWHTLRRFGRIEEDRETYLEVYTLEPSN